MVIKLRKTVILVGSCLVVLLALLSCGTSRKALRLQSEPEVTVEQGGITMSLRFLDEPSLRQRFGSSENPFLTEYDRLFFRRNVVFELTIRNQSSGAYLFSLHDCELRYGGKVLAPSNRFQIATDAENRSEERKLKERKMSLANRYILPNRKAVPPDGVLSGFLLFQGNLTSTGEAQVVIPGESAGPVFQFQFVF